MTDTSSGLAIAFTLPDDADTQTIMGRLQLVVNDDAAGSEDTEWQLVRMVAGSLTAQSFGASLANDANNRVTTADGSGGLNGEANLTFDGTTLNVVGNAGVGIARTDGTLHVHTASAGTVTAETVADDLVVENSAAGGVTVLTPDGYSGRYQFGTPSDAGHSYIESFYNSGAEWMNFHVGGTNRMRIHDGGILSINETANANMTVGLTINQGANDNEILALKSSDVAHGMTSAFGETDTFGMIRKVTAASGGLALNGASEGPQGLQLNAYATTEDSTKTTGGGGNVFVQAQLASGTTSVAHSANANLFAVYSGGTQFIVDREGDYFYNGSGSAYDFNEAIGGQVKDAELVRAFDLTTADPKTIIRSKWDQMVRYNKQSLVDAGIVGYCSPEDEARGHRGLVNGAQLQRLTTGAIWQTHVEVMELREALDAERSQRMALEARLNLIEQKGRN